MLVSETNLEQPVELWQRAVTDGHLRLDTAGRSTRIVYVASGHSEDFTDPEERVRANIYAELIYAYEYSPTVIGVEVVVPDRKPSDRADLVVFRDERKTRPFAVIECKREGISDAEFAQAVEQAAGNGTWAKLRADYVMVAAGATRQVLDFTGAYGVYERHDNIVADLPRRYGRPEEYKYRRGGAVDLSAVRKDQLISALGKCHQTLWGGGKLSPPAAFGELSKLIFVKVSDEKALRKVGSPYEFQIKSHEGPERLAERIRRLYEEHRRRDPDVFEDQIRVDDLTMRTIVEHLEGISLSDTDLDVKGVAFETFMDGFFKGDFGQYFTPREVIAFAVALLKPTATDVILDPACGSGGFLLHALDAIVQEADEHFERDTARHLTHWRDFARSHLFGIEINEEIARVAKMNMIIHEDGHSNVIRHDALAPVETATRRNPGFVQEGFSLVLTNPPFGAQVTATQAPWLGEYELGSARASTGSVRARRAQRTEILFVERIFDYLKPGGRAAVILPDGVLSNASSQYVRDFIIDRFRLLAVVSLPTTAFSHFGTTVKASILFLRKRMLGEEVQDSEEVFLAAAESVGYDGTGRPAANQLPQILEAYRVFEARLAASVE